MALFRYQDDWIELSDEHFQHANSLEDLIDELALIHDIKKALEKAKRQWEETDHDQVRKESIQRLQENVLSYIHPSLISFAGESDWITQREWNYLNNVHARGEDSGYRGIMRADLSTRGIVMLHYRILDLWERDME